MATTVLSSSAGTAVRARFAPMAPVLRAEGARRVVVLSGEWDIASRPVLVDVLSQLIASGTGDVVVDLADAEFIDTAIGRALAEGCQRLARGGRTLTFRSPSPLAARVMGEFGLTDLIETPKGGGPMGHEVLPRHRGGMARKREGVAGAVWPRQAIREDPSKTTRRKNHGRRCDRE